MTRPLEARIPRGYPKKIRWKQRCLFAWLTLIVLVILSTMISIVVLMIVYFSEHGAGMPERESTTPASLTETLRSTVIATLSSTHPVLHKASTVTGKKGHGGDKSTPSATPPFTPSLKTDPIWPLSSTQWWQGTLIPTFTLNAITQTPTPRADEEALKDAVLGLIICLFLSALFFVLATVIALRTCCRNVLQNTKFCASSPCCRRLVYACCARRDNREPVVEAEMTDINDNGNPPPYSPVASNQRIYLVELPTYEQAMNRENVPASTPVGCPCEDNIPASITVDNYRTVLCRGNPLYTEQGMEYHPNTCSHVATCQVANSQSGDEFVHSQNVHVQSRCEHLAHSHNQIGCELVQSQVEQSQSGRELTVTSQVVSRPVESEMDSLQEVPALPEDLVEGEAETAFTVSHQNSCGAFNPCSVSETLGEPSSSPPDSNNVS